MIEYLTCLIPTTIWYSLKIIKVLITSCFWLIWNISSDDVSKIIWIKHKIRPLILIKLIKFDLALLRHNNIILSRLNIDRRVIKIPGTWNQVKIFKVSSWNSTLLKLATTNDSGSFDSIWIYNMHCSCGKRSTWKSRHCHTIIICIQWGKTEIFI